MELRAITTNKDGKQVRHKPQMPSIGQVLNAVQEDGQKTVPSLVPCSSLIC